MNDYAYTSCVYLQAVVIVSCLTENILLCCFSSLNMLMYVYIPIFHSSTSVSKELTLRKQHLGPLE